jgi:hypothetical protein
MAAHSRGAKEDLDGSAFARCQGRIETFCERGFRFDLLMDVVAAFAFVV